MPLFRLETNVPASKVTEEFLLETTNLLSKSLGKPRDYCVASIVPDVKMVWADNSGQPCGYAQLMSIGKLGPAENKKLAKIFFDHVETHLGIPKNRMYINFLDVPPAELGYNGSTFAK